jgi:hypothetical protein
MSLAGVSARPDRSEKRTFACPHCDFIETKVVPDPLMSDELKRLANNIRPPA